MQRSWLGALALAALWGCSTDSESVVSSAETEGEIVAKAENDAKKIETSVVQARVSMCSHNVRHGWAFEDTTAAFDPEKEISVAVENDSAAQEGNFAVDATVAVDTAESFTIVAAGTDGDGDGWIVRAEKGDLEFHWRDSDKSENWKKVRMGGELPADEWTDVRVERVDSFVIIYVNGKAKGAFVIEGKLGDVHGNITVGHDKQEKDKCHCKGGRLEHVYVENVKEIEDFSESESEADTSTVEKIEPMIDDSSAETVWIADWEFDDSTNVGRDFSGNGHEAIIGEGAVTAVDGIAKFDGASGFSVDLAKDLVVNEFVLETRVKLAEYGRMQNIIVAEPPGRGVDGWQLRVDEGSLTFHIRDDARDYDDWRIFYGKNIALNEWTDIRVERSNDSIKVFQDGELTVAAAYKGDVTQMRYDWGIGYDAMDQAYHNRYFNGEMDYIRFGKFSSFSGGSLKNAVKAPLVAWEFNEPLFVGLDRMANNSTRDLYGNPVVVDSTVTLDGLSGLVIPLSKIFRRSQFAVEARVKPTAFAPMQNIIVAEPPGRYGDGWMLRVDDGVLTAHFRDEDLDGTTWNVFSGERLNLDAWNDIRMERSADSVKVFQNGKLVIAEAYSGDVSQLGYDIGIGFDAMMQAIHNRYFEGEIDYIRYYDF